MEIGRSGNGKHGACFFARFQSEGKGQRGKNWQSSPDDNILMSILLEDPLKFQQKPFVLSMLMANTCRYFLQQFLTKEVKIKWPNDLIIADRKAGGILIENIYRGANWNWAVVGIGININQSVFSEELTNVTSFFKITDKRFPVVSMAKELHKLIVLAYDEADDTNFTSIIENYNAHLYKYSQQVSLEIQNEIIALTVKGVNDEGFLLTSDLQRPFIRHGEAEWKWD